MPLKTQLQLGSVLFFVGAWVWLAGGLLFYAGGSLWLVPGQLLVGICWLGTSLFMYRAQRKLPPPS